MKHEHKLNVPFQHLYLLPISLEMICQDQFHITNTKQLFYSFFPFQEWRTNLSQKSTVTLPHNNHNQLQHELQAPGQTTMISKYFWAMTHVQQLLVELVLNLMSSYIKQCSNLGMITKIRFDCTCHVMFITLCSYWPSYLYNVV